MLDVFRNDVHDVESHHTQTPIESDHVLAVKGGGKKGSHVVTSM